MLLECIICFFTFFNLNFSGYKVLSIKTHKKTPKLLSEIKSNISRIYSLELHLNANSSFLYRLKM